MVRIAAFSALVAGLLLVVPAVLSDAEAGWTAGVAPKGDRLIATLPTDTPQHSAVEHADLCTASPSDAAESWCVAR
jgi:hypothetical protein